MKGADKKSYTYEEIKQKMVNYCVYQDRSHFEVEQKMKEYLLIPEAKEEILLFLIKENFLNEERFAKSYARGKFYIKKWGKNKIRMSLLQKGISERLIKKSFEEIDDEDYKRTISDLINKTMLTYKGLQEYQKKQKLIKFLISRGFEYEVVLLNLE